jgi:hypothetical protein
MVGRSGGLRAYRLGGLDSLAAALAGSATRPHSCQFGRTTVGDHPAPTAALRPGDAIRATGRPQKTKNLPSAPAISALAPTRLAGSVRDCAIDLNFAASAASTMVVVRWAKLGARSALRYSSAQSSTRPTIRRRNFALRMPVNAFTTGTTPRSNGAPEVACRISSGVPANRKTVPTTPKAMRKHRSFAPRDPGRHIENSSRSLKGSWKAASSSPRKRCSQSPRRATGLSRGLARHS